MLVLEWKERAFIKKVNSRCCCWFPAAILVHQNATPIWRLPTKVYKVRETFRQITQKLWATKTWDLNKLFIYKSLITFHFLGFFHWTVSNLFFCCVTVKTIYRVKVCVNDKIRYSIWVRSHWNVCLGSLSKQCVFLETDVWKQQNHLLNPAYFDIFK